MDNNERHEYIDIIDRAARATLPAGVSRLEFHERMQAYQHGTPLNQISTDGLREIAEWAATADFKGWYAYSLHHTGLTPNSGATAKRLMEFSAQEVTTP